MSKIDKIIERIFIKRKRLAERVKDLTDPELFNIYLENFF